MILTSLVVAHPNYRMVLVRGLMEGRIRNAHSPQTSEMLSNILLGENICLL